jgi:hypothetical protein
MPPAKADPYAAHWARRRRHARLNVALFVAPVLMVPFFALGASAPLAQSLLVLAGTLAWPFVSLPRATLPCPRCKTDFPVIGMFEPSEAAACPGCALAVQTP